MLNLSITANLAPVHRALLDFGHKQVTFAAAAALTKLAQGVAAIETETVKQTFDNPTPFTQNAWRVVPATKSALASMVLAKDIQAAYLAPYVFGGPRFLGPKKAMLVPKAQAVNQFGNLPRNTLKRLQGRSDIYIGPVKVRGVVINGVWQCAAVGKRRDGTIGPITPKGSKAPSKLKLLIRFEDTTEAPKHLQFVENAKAYVAAHARREFEAALRRALATAR